MSSGLVGNVSDEVLVEGMRNALAPLAPSERELYALVTLWEMDFGRDVRPAFAHDDHTARLAFWRWAVRATVIIEQAHRLMDARS